MKSVRLFDEDVVHWKMAEQHQETDKSAKRNSEKVSTLAKVYRKLSVVGSRLTLRPGTLKKVATEKKCRLTIVNLNLC